MKSQGVALVVDDDSDVRDALVAVLEDEGWAVETASDGQAALDRLERGLRPDVVLLDVMMPVMDGAAAYQRMRQRPEWQNIPVVAMSASHRARTNAVFPHFVEKPVTVDALMGTLRMAMGR